MIEFQSEYSFALRTPEFKTFAHELALHIVASGGSDLPLVLQSWFRDDSLKVGDKFKDLSQDLGVKVKVLRYTHYEAGST
jgi:translation elongation factor EF-Ts